MEKEKSKLRDAPFAFLDLLNATAGDGTRFQIGATDVRYCCFICDVTFEQTAEGFVALRAHEMEHGRGNCVDLAELDGRTLRIVTWVVTNDHGGSWESRSPEIWGVDDEAGVVYHLSNAYQGDTVWKWRITRKHSGLLASLNVATPSVQD
ncbi:MAG TPA: hypothetical protein VNH84_02290 [Candidatus Saccharimonadales bacterium]|nr:hypothetical protein [Candidatus Saccharimonadales bacterium]